MPANKSVPTSPLGTPRGGPRHASLSHPVPPIADTVSAAAAALGVNTSSRQGSLHGGSGACLAKDRCNSQLTVSKNAMLVFAAGVPRLQAWHAHWLLSLPPLLASTSIVHQHVCMRQFKQGINASC